MKQKMAFLVVTIGLGVFISGCSTYSPQSFWEVSQTKVDLEAKNFKVRKLGAQGSAVTPYLFGIPLMGGGVAGIPLDSQDIQTRSIRQLHRNWDGKGSAFFHNINVEWTNYGIPGIFLFHQHTVTADVYEFDREYVDYAQRRN